MLGERSSCLGRSSGEQHSYLFHASLLANLLYSRKNVRKKLNAMPMEFADKVVMLVDGELTYMNIH
jgi:hypothetical protein